MKTLFTILMLCFMAVSAPAGPPEPPEASDVPEAPPVKVERHKIVIPMLDTVKLNAMTKNLEGMDKKINQLDKMMREFSDSIEIKDLSIGGDSIKIVLSNDSVIYLDVNTVANVSHDDKSFVNVGHTYTVNEGEVLTGNIVNVGADVKVKGTVNGSVMTIGGDIYVASTGYIRDGAVALSGKLKVDPGGRVTNVKMAFNESRNHTYDSNTNIYRVMAAIFLAIYITWLVLAATMTSLFKSNIEKVANIIRKQPWKSFFLGYLAYLLVFVAMIALTVTILGIPVAAVGVPVALFAGMVLAVTSLSHIIGQKLLSTQETTLRTFLYGSLILAGLPGLFFLIQLVSGSLVMMVFSWIMIGFLIFIIVPLGLGAVLTTRFGTRIGPPPKTPVVPIPPAPPVEPSGPQIAPQAPSA